MKMIDNYDDEKKEKKGSRMTMVIQIKWIIFGLC